MPSWAIIPFEQIEPKWKVLMIDGQSPIQKKFDPDHLPADRELPLDVRGPMPDSRRDGFLLPKPRPEQTGDRHHDRRDRDGASHCKDNEHQRAFCIRVKKSATCCARRILLTSTMKCRSLRAVPHPDPNQADQVFCSEPRLHRTA